MKKKRQKTLMIIALVSIFVCGCPGCLALFEGLRYFPPAVGTSSSFEDVARGLGAGFMNGGWMVCLSGLLILVPFILVLSAVIQRAGKADDIEELPPTGASQDDPIPPTS
jgi:hypothetical protein